jgi:hypothetical protein
LIWISWKYVHTHIYIYIADLRELSWFISRWINYGSWYTYIYIYTYIISS